jgi:hypothetical protein
MPGGGEVDGSARPVAIETAHHGVESRTSGRREEQIGHDSGVAVVVVDVREEVSVRKVGGHHVEATLLDT